MNSYQQIGVTANAIQNGWMAFFRLLARQYGLKFVWGGNPSTDGKTIHLPHLPKDLNSDDLTMVKGDGFHEVGHCRFTAFDAFTDFGIKHGATHQSWLNAIEDPWMEKKMAKGGRNIEKYLRKSSEILFSKGRAKLGDDNQADAFGAFLLCTLFTEVNGWSEYSEPAELAKANFIRLFGEGGEDIITRVKQVLIAEAPSCGSTADNCALTLRVISLLKQYAEDEDNKKDEDEEEKGDDQDGKSDQSNSEEGDGDEESEGDGSGGDESSDDDSSDDSNGQESSKGDSSEPGAGDQQGDASSKGGKGDDDPDNSGSDAEGSSEGGDGKPSMSEKVDDLLNTKPSEGEVFDLKDAIEELAEDIKNNQSESYNRSDLKSTPSTGEFDPGCAAGNGDYIDGITVIQGDAEKAKELRASVGPRAGVLAGNLQQILRSQTEEDYRVTRKGRSLVGGKLHRISLGNHKVFASTEIVETGTAAVSILTDMSYSTHCNPCSLVTAQSLMLFTDVFEAIQADMEILGFGADKETAVSLIKGFDEPETVARLRIGGMRNDSGGGTPLLEGLTEASLRLSERTNYRKVMFVLTDGDPCDTDACAQETKRVEAEGIEVVYILLGTQVSSKWLSKAGVSYIEAPSFDDVVPMLLNQLRHSLG